MLPLAISLVVLYLISWVVRQIIEPKIVGDKIGLSSLGVITAVIVMGGYFGVIGTFFGVPIFAVICTLINAWVESRLKKKDFSVALADYYSESSLIDPNEEHVSLWNRTFAFLNDKIVVKVKDSWKARKNKKTKANGSDDNQTNNSDTQTIEEEKE